MEDDVRSAQEPTGAASRRKDLASLLRANEGVVLALLQSAAQAILSIDRHGRMVLVNARTEEMFGYSGEELLGASVELLLPETSRAVHQEHRVDYFEKPRVRPMGIGMDLRGRRADGTEFPVEVSLSYVQTEEGLFAIAFVTDITQRKRLERELLQAQKLEAVGRLAGGIAHDFNNMLTIISGYTEMVLDQVPAADPMRSAMEDVLNAAERAQALTNQLLTFSRRQVIQPRVVDVNALIANTDKMLRRLIGEDIELVLTLAEQVGTIRADPSQIEQAIFNLAVNARDAMPNGGRLTIETAAAHLDENYSRMHFDVQPGKYVVVAISDTGHGMDMDTKNRVFEPFFTTKETGKGTGLGLSIVYGIVKQSGGDIWVDSEPSKGTTVKLYFPMIANALNEPQSTGSPSSHARASEMILVVEDERGVRELIATVLRERGYKVLTTGDPLDAIKMMRQHQSAISMLLTDVVMPGMSGKRLVEELLRLRPGLKVLYVSGYTDNVIAHYGVLDVDVEFIGKPFSQGALLQKVREILDK
jgi:PAS domain S-box-containing protein